MYSLEIVDKRILEIRTLDTEDENMEADVYEIELYGKNILIALGEAKYAFIDDSIVYYPVYIIKNDLVNSQIGVFEIMSNKAPYIYDDDGDINIAELGPILLYSYVTPTLINEKPDIQASTLKEVKIGRAHV